MVKNVLHEQHHCGVVHACLHLRTATAHGGQLVVDALAKDFGLWEKIRACSCMDPRRDKSRGFSPEVIVSQILFSFCSGGISLADAERLGTDKALRQLLGMERWADESTLGQWLRAQDEESLKQLWAIIREFVGWVLKKAKPGRVRHGGALEVFFDDTQIEVDGRCFKGTALTRILRELQTIRLGQISVGRPGAPLLARLTKVPAHLNSLLPKLKLLPLFATPPKWAAFPAEAQL